MLGHESDLNLRWVLKTPWFSSYDQANDGIEIDFSLKSLWTILWQINQEPECILVMLEDIYIWNVFIYMKEKLLQKCYQWSLCTDWSFKRKNFDHLWHFNTSTTHVFRFVPATQMVMQSRECGRNRKQSSSLFLGFICRNASSNSKIPGGKREGGEEGKQQLFHLSIQNQ